jgi:hypothetical protein
MIDTKRQRRRCTRRAARSFRSQSHSSQTEGFQGVRLELATSVVGRAAAEATEETAEPEARAAEAVLAVEPAAVP